MSTPIHTRVIQSIKQRKTKFVPLKTEASKAELKEMLKQAVINTQKVKSK